LQVAVEIRRVALADPAVAAMQFGEENDRGEGTLLAYSTLASITSSESRDAKPDFQ
jgi:hypothetical protein